MLLAGPPRRGEHGFSLVESVIAVAVLGIIAAAMVGGMATFITTSDIHRQQSAANAVMVSAVERVKNAPYASCDSLPANSLPAKMTYLAAAQRALPTSPLWQTAIPPAITTTVKYWNSQTSEWDVSPCHDTETSGDGLGGPFPMQLVTILVTNPGNRASTSVDIVKRGR